MEETTGTFLASHYTPEEIDPSLVERIQLVELLVERSTDYAIFLVDLQGTVVTWNQGALRMFGYGKADILGQNYAGFYTIEDVAAGIPQHHLQQVQEQAAMEDDRWQLRRDGSRFFASSVMLRMRNNEHQCFIKVLRDMTASRQAEEGRARQQAQIAVLEERQRMAQELHDTFAQGFTGIAVQLEAAKDILHSDPHNAEEHLERASTLARESLREARHVVHALRPAGLQTQDLSTALAQLVEQMTAGTAVTGEYLVQGKARALLPMVEDDLLRIAQEALTNTMRHAQCSRVSVELSFGEQTVQLWVEDNGQGFDALAPVAHGHWGLQGIRERVQRLKGHLAIRSQPEQGTQIVVSIPH